GRVGAPIGAVIPTGDVQAAKAVNRPIKTILALLSSLVGGDFLEQMFSGGLYRRGCAAISLPFN
ncbi:MAG TPA: hypothetical protein PLS24_03700, partial [Sedimentisphaerales bacterium]|nr:hypothetical protein [Sedimentisphaerales bacterium]